jgi:hypothetical protein
MNLVEIENPERERFLINIPRVFKHGENGIINFDLTTQRSYVVFSDGRLYWVTDILKDWLDANPKEKETYFCPFTGKVV